MILMKALQMYFTNDTSFRAGSVKHDNLSEYDINLLK